MFAKLLPASLLAAAACVPVDQIPESVSAQRDLHSSGIVHFSDVCEKWDDWDKPTEPFQIHANTYYVGTCGIAAILITGDEAHTLIDSGTEAGADVVLSNIAALGFDPRHVSIVLNSHEHFDHVGGMAAVQEATGAIVVSTEISIEVMDSGIAHPADPQFGMHGPMDPIAQGVSYLTPDIQELLTSLGLTAIETPGHSPGAMSWRWESCDAGGWQKIVYADSLSPVSRDDYKFSDHPDYIAKYRAGLERLAALDCDILLTPHPSHSRMIERAATGSFMGGVTCAEYAEGKRRDLDARLTREAGGDQ